MGKKQIEVQHYPFMAELVDNIDATVVEYGCDSYEDAIFLAELLADENFSVLIWTEDGVLVDTVTIEDLDGPDEDESTDTKEQIVECS